jgi:hypothetical protein
MVNADSRKIKGQGIFRNTELSVTEPVDQDISMSRLD